MYFSLEILSFLWNCGCRSERNRAIFSSLTWAALQRACPHQDMKMFQLHLYLWLLSTPLLFRETHKSSQRSWAIHFAFGVLTWLTLFKEKKYISRVRQLPGDYYTAADAEGHRLFLLRSTLPYTKKLSSWPFILSWLWTSDEFLWFHHQPLAILWTSWGGEVRRWKEVPTRI